MDAPCSSRPCPPGGPAGAGGHDLRTRFSRSCGRRPQRTASTLLPPPWRGGWRTTVQRRAPCIPRTPPAGWRYGSGNNAPPGRQGCRAA
eukprot:7171885-Lingulodinium_polyedra.AAC.1